MSHRLTESKSKSKSKNIKHKVNKSIDDLKALSKILEYCKLYKVKPTEELVNAVDSIKLSLKLENKNE